MIEPDPGITADEILARRELLIEQGNDVSIDDLVRDVDPAVGREVRRRLSHVLAAEFALGDAWTVTAPAASSAAAAADRGAPLGCAGRYVSPVIRAEGGMGVVCTADDLELGRRVAYKVMKADQIGQPGAVARFFNEAEITARLSHPGVLPVYGRVTDDSGLPAYAAEFVSGATLAREIERLREIGADDFEARARARGVLIRSFIATCHIVAHAHSRAVVHGDVKPLNIMIDEFGATRLIDWGVACVVDAENAASLEIPTPRPGTPWFISSPYTTATTASDVYALGMTLCLILADGDPRRHDDLKPASDVAPALWAVACKATCLDRTRRYHSAEELAREAQDVLDDKPVSAYRDPLGTRLRRWSARRRPVVAALGALMLAAAVGGPFLGARERRLRNRADAERDRVVALTGDVVEQAELIGKFQATLPDSRALLGRAVNLIEQLARDDEARAADPGVVASYYDRAARIYQTLNQHDVADACFRRATTLAEQRQALAPSDRDNRNRWANSLRDWGVTLYSLGRADDAARLWTRALDVIATATDDQPETRWARARIQFALGNHSMLAGDQAQARATFDQARGVAESLTAEHPDDRRFLKLLADVENNLGLSFQYEAMPRGFRVVAPAKLASSADAHRRALALRRRAARLDPGRPETLADVAASLNHLANVSLASGGPGLVEAEPLYREARATLETLVTAYPGVPSNRRELAEVLSNQNVLMTQQKRFDDAARLARSAIEIFERLVADYPDLPDLYSDQGVVLEQYAATLRRADKPAEAADQHFASARAFSLAEARTRDPKRRSDLAAKALALLVALKSDGYFNDPEHAAALRREPAFAPLRDNPLFPAPASQ